MVRCLSAGPVRDFDIEARTVRPGLDRRGPDIGLRTDAVGHQAAVRHVADQPLNLRVVDAERRETVERNVGDERFEGPPQIGERAIEVEMFGIDIGHDGDGRRQA